MTTATRAPTDDVIELLRNHAEAPTITPTDDIIQHDNTVFIIHEPGEVTRVGVTRRNGEVCVAGIVRITSTCPDITPADDVITVGHVTRIIHGPGRETRVLR